MFRRWNSFLCSSLLSSRNHYHRHGRLASSGVIGASTSSSSTNNDITTNDKPPPFYGLPRPPKTEPRTLRNRLSTAIHYATTAFSDPTRADAVAALGEITGGRTLERLVEQVKSDPIGRRILKERPVVSKDRIHYEQLIQLVPDDPTRPDITFGQAYGCFLKTHGFDPDERDQVRFVEDDTLAYVMLRYRQCHDYWHTLTGLPPTVLGELGLKWLELFQTGFPIAALSSTVGALRLNDKERQILTQKYLPWAMETSQNITVGSLLNVYYEEEFDTPIPELRTRLNIQPAPRIY